MHHAERLFSEVGFEGASTREIARAAGVNISMISYYFDSKEKLYQRIIEYRIGQSITFSNDILANTEMSEWEKMSAVVDRYMRRLLDERSIFVIIHREQLNRKNGTILSTINNSKKGLLKVYKILLEEGHKKGVFTKTPRVELLHATISGTLFHALNSVDFYREATGGGDDFNENFIADLGPYIKSILKNQLGYEQND